MAVGFFEYDGKLSTDFGVYITGSGTFGAPERDIETLDIPGRSGTLTMDKGRFKNISVTYPAFISKDFRKRFAEFRAFMLSKPGYRILRDTYNYDRFRKARFLGPISPDMVPGYEQGEFKLTFDCAPQWWLDEGTRSISVTSGIILRNPTFFDAKPLIRAYGTGSVSVGDISVAVDAVGTAYTDIDCDLQIAFEGSVNRNSHIILTDGIFPVLQPGDNLITYTGFSSVEITPRFWTV